MFGTILPPGVELVRITALTGRKGKPPCLWEGPPTTEQATIESQIAQDRRVTRWLHKNGMVQNGVATLKLQLDLFSQGKRLESITLDEASFLVDKPRSRRPAGDEIGLRAFDLAENMFHLFQQMLAERDTVIGRLVERGFKHNEVPPPAPIEAQKSDFVSDLIEKGGQFVSLAKMFRELKENE